MNHPAWLTLSIPRPRRGEGLWRHLVRIARRLTRRVPSGSQADTRPTAKALQEPVPNGLDRFPTSNHFALERERHRGQDRRGKKLSRVVQAELAFRRLVPEFCDLPSRRECPPKEIAFLTVTNARYFRGVEALLLSLLRVYPELESPFIVLHDDSLTDFARQRLLDIYPRCEFRLETLDWFRYDSDGSPNHRRIGRLGFLNTRALELRGYEHVIVLDADLLVLGDISELWQSRTEISASYCFGDREYVAVSERTGRGILNSGVISIPACFLGPTSQDEMKRILERIADPACPLLDRFADQKAWNLFLADKPVRTLPYNYNCNVKQLARVHQGTLEGIRVLHYAGPKPWLTSDYATKDDSETERLNALTYHTPWRSLYRTLLYEKRLSSYRVELERTRRTPVSNGKSVAPESCIILGNGPSIANTELTHLRAVEKFCFNWFLHHPDYERLAPEHLILGSHLFFGGWNTLDPAFPADFLNLLRKKTHRPVLWAPFYFKPIFEREGLLDEFECNFVLFEKPFKRFVERAGYGRTGLDGFLMDGRSGPLSVGIPIACHLGFRRLVLVGCDASYQQNDARSDYFYPEEAHTSARNPASTLRETWAPGGPGQFGYGLIERQLRAEGRQLVDATVGGSLTTVPKIPYADLVAELRR